MKSHGFNTIWVKTLVALFFSLGQWLPPCCVSCACVWAAWVLVTLVLIPWSSGILLWSCSTSHMHCMFSQMPGTASGCVLHHSTCLSILSFLYCSLGGCSLSLSSFATIYVIKIFHAFLFIQCFLVHSLHLNSVQQHQHLLIVYFTSIPLGSELLHLSISCIISSWFMPLMNCSFESSIMIFVIVLCSFHTEPTPMLLCGFILISL